MAKTRLDTLLVERGLFESRSKAAASVMAGSVLVGDGSRPNTKPGTLVPADVALDVKPGPRHVSRGGTKLEHALERLGVEARGRLALDVGASTGGFTDCLLQAGAEHVVALDVAYGALHWSLRRDPRVTVVERRNARDLRPQELPYAPDLIVVDVSFIGLSKVLPAVLACAAERFEMLALVKPQFELGRDRVGKGGVVRDCGDRVDALVSVGTCVRSLGIPVLGYCASGLPGPAGNRESFIWCARGKGDAIEDLRAGALVAEPEARP